MKLLPHQELKAMMDKDDIVKARAEAVNNLIGKVPEKYLGGFRLRRIDHGRIKALEKQVGKLQAALRMIANDADTMIGSSPGFRDIKSQAEEALKIKPFAGVKNRNLERYAQIEDDPRFSHRCPETGFALDKHGKRFASHIPPKQPEPVAPAPQPKRWETELKDFPLTDEQLFVMVERVGMDRFVDALSERVLTVGRSRGYRWSKIAAMFGLTPSRIAYLAKRLGLK